MLWIGFGFLGMIRTSSLVVRPRVVQSCPRLGHFWPSGLISRKEIGKVVESSPRETGAFKAVVTPAGAILGIGNNKVIFSGWSSMDINLADPVEVALAARVQQAAIDHVADSTSGAYVGPWNAFVKWCGERLSERCPLPASDHTVALYLQSVSDGSKTFAPVKSASEAIAFEDQDHSITRSLYP